MIVGKKTGATQSCPCGTELYDKGTWGSINRVFDGQRKGPVCSGGRK